MTRIDGRTSFARTPEEIFDFLADPRHEPAYNPRVLSARKETPGPISPGTRFAQRVKSFGRAGDVSIRLVDCERPHHLTWAIGSTGMAIDGTEEITQENGRTTVHWSWDFRPRGGLRLLGPLVGWAGRRLEQRVWADMKSHLEADDHDNDETAGSEVEHQESAGPPPAARQAGSVCLPIAARAVTDDDGGSMAGPLSRGHPTDGPRGRHDRG